MATKFARNRMGNRQKGDLVGLAEPELAALPPSSAPLLSSAAAAMTVSGCGVSEFKTFDTGIRPNLSQKRGVFDGDKLTIACEFSPRSARFSHHSEALTYSGTRPRHAQAMLAIERGPSGRLATYARRTCCLRVSRAGSANLMTYWPCGPSPCANGIQ